MASGPDGPRSRRDRASDDRARSRRAARRLALASVFEAEFGQRTADAILERHLGTEGDPDVAGLAREIVGNVVLYRDALDARITAAAPQYPVVCSPGWTARCCVAACVKCYTRPRRRPRWR